jgi:hypothetical protein
VEELVGYEVNGAVHIFLDAKVEFERPTGLVARRECNVLQLAARIGDVLACFSGLGVSFGLSVEQAKGVVHCTV